MSTRVYRAIYLAVILASATAFRVSAQVQYVRGQDVSPAFDGWERNPDGTFSMVFGYLNRNYEEELDIPVGPNNAVDPGSDRGQPTHFYARRQRFVFKVVVPQDWDKNRRVVWTLISRGKTSQAKGWLQPEWELSPGVISENSGGGMLDPENQPPSVTGSPDQTVTLPNPATLTASATDDGRPKPKPRPARSSADPTANADKAAPRPPQGVRIKLILYRGPGKVEIDPDNVSADYGKPAMLTSKVSFSAPGKYVFHAIASDGQLYSTHEVTVTVNPQN